MLESIKKHNDIYSQISHLFDELDEVKNEVLSELLKLNQDELIDNFDSLYGSVAKFEIYDELIKKGQGW